MVTREEILSIEEYCAEYKISHKKRLAELDIPFWHFYKAKRKYLMQDEPPIKPSDWTGFKRRLFHIADKEYGITVQCYDISTANDKTTLVLSLKNQSIISYQTTAPRFVIEGRKTTRKKPQIKKTIYPVSCTNSRISVSPSGEIIAAYSFDKLTLMKDQVLKVYFYENGGMRNYVLNVCARDVNLFKYNIADAVN